MQEPKPSLVIYKIHDEETVVKTPGGILTNDFSTSLLREFHDYSPPLDRRVAIGERLYANIAAIDETGEPVTRALPTNWVVTRIERYVPPANNQNFNGGGSDNQNYLEIIIAYCKLKFMTPEEFKNSIQDLGL